MYLVVFLREILYIQWSSRALSDIVQNLFFFYNTPQSVEAVLSSQPILSSHPAIPHR